MSMYSGYQGAELPRIINANEQSGHGDVRKQAL